MKTQMMALIFLVVITIIYWGLILFHRDASHHKDNLLMGLAMTVAVIIFGIIVMITIN